MSKRVLILAYYFPPMAVSGSMRPAGFCSHLHEHGYEAHVVSNAVPPSDGGSIPVDESLMRLLPGQLKIDRVPHKDWMQALLNARQWIRERRRSGVPPAPAVHSDSRASTPGQGSRLRVVRDRILNRALMFPDRQNRWIAATRRHVRGLASADRPDVVFATGNPWSSLVAGLDISRMLDVPFVADFRDPWTQNPKPPLPELVTAAARCERRIVTHADRVIANTDALRASFMRQYPEAAARIVTVTNGYHESLILPGIPDGSAPARQGQIELNYYGSIYELRKPTALLAAIKTLADAGQINGRNFRVTFTGHWGVVDATCNRLAEQLEDQDLIRRQPAVSHEDYLARIRSSQHLLVLQQDFPLQIPGKLYEYVATGRPLFLVGGQGATASLVQERKLGYVCADDHEQLCEAIRALVERRLRILPPDSDAIESFGYAALTRQLVDILNEVTTT